MTRSINDYIEDFKKHLVDRDFSYYQEGNTIFITEWPGFVISILIDSELIIKITSDIYSNREFHIGINQLSESEIIDALIIERLHLLSGVVEHSVLWNHRTENSTKESKVIQDSFHYSYWSHEFNTKGYELHQTPIEEIYTINYDNKQVRLEFDNCGVQVSILVNGEYAEIEKIPHRNNTANLMVACILGSLHDYVHEKQEVEMNHGEFLQEAITTKKQQVTQHYAKVWSVLEHEGFSTQRLADCSHIGIKIEEYFGMSIVFTLYTIQLTWWRVSKTDLAVDKVQLAINYDMPVNEFIETVYEANKNYALNQDPTPKALFRKYTVL